MRTLLPMSILTSLAVAAPVAQAAVQRPATSAEAVPAPRSTDGAPTADEVRHKARAADARAQEFRPKPPPAPEPEPASPELEAIASCESGGDPTAVSATGQYRGKYQFSVETWQAVGGSGDPAAAPEAEQDRLAQVLYETAGPGQWPVCSQ